MCQNDGLLKGLSNNPSRLEKQPLVQNRGKKDDGTPCMSEQVQTLRLYRRMDLRYAPRCGCIAVGDQCPALIDLDTHVPDGSIPFFDEPVDRSAAHVHLVELITRTVHFPDHPVRGDLTGKIPRVIDPHPDAGFGNNVLGGRARLVW